MFGLDTRTIIVTMYAFATTTATVVGGRGGGRLIFSIRLADRRLQRTPVPYGIFG